MFASATSSKIVRNNIICTAFETESVKWSPSYEWVTVKLFVHIMNLIEHKVFAKNKQKTIRINGQKYDRNKLYMTKVFEILRRADINGRWNNVRRRSEENVNAGDGKTGKRICISRSTPGTHETHKNPTWTTPTAFTSRC